MRFRLRTLLILGAVGPPILAGAWLFRSELPHPLDIILWLLFAAIVLGGLCSVILRVLGY